MATKQAVAAGTHKSSDARTSVWVTRDDKKRDTYVRRDVKQTKSGHEVKSNVVYVF